MSHTIPIKQIVSRYTSLLEESADAPEEFCRQAINGALHNRSHSGNNIVGADQ
jgi:hypothetical protein